MFYCNNVVHLNLVKFVFVIIDFLHVSTNKFFFAEMGLDLRVLWTSLAQRLLIPAAQELIVLNTS